MKKYIIPALAIVFVLGITGSVHAGPPNLLSGWGWSSTIGWLNFSGSAANGSTYGVTVSTTSTAYDGKFDGYAWSSNVGWVSFRNDTYSNLTSDCGPVAAVDLQTGKVSGWARAIAGKEDITDGWNGCIELAGTHHESTGNNVSGGVALATTSTTGNFVGKAWGSTNVGWLSFAGVVCPGCVGGIQTGPLTASCASTTATSFANGASSNVGFAATSVSGGTSPYKYYWKGFTALEGQTNATTSSYTGTNQTFGGPALSIKDSAVPSNSVSPVCPSVVFGNGGINGTAVNGACSDPLVWNQCSDSTLETLSDEAGYHRWNCLGRNGGTTASCSVAIDNLGSGDLDLKIGRPGRAIYPSLTVRRNTNFSLAWVNNYLTDSDYECASVVSNGSWSTGWGQTAADNLDSSPLNSGNAVGTFKFTLSCTNTVTGVTAAASTTLRVTSMGEVEI